VAFRSSETRQGPPETGKDGCAKKGDSKACSCSPTHRGKEINEGGCEKTQSSGYKKIKPGRCAKVRSPARAVTGRHFTVSEGPSFADRRGGAFLVLLDRNPQPSCRQVFGNSFRGFPLAFIHHCASLMVNAPSQLKGLCGVHAGNRFAKELDNLLVRVTVAVVDDHAGFQPIARADTLFFG
jgi:hypothetical protein